MHAGKLLKQIRNINALEINDEKDFGERSHTTSSEPFYYETGYSYNYLQYKLSIDRTKRSIVRIGLLPCNDECVSYSSAIPIDENGKAHLYKLTGANKWQCSIACRALGSKDIESILDLKKSFDEHI